MFVYFLKKQLRNRSFLFWSILFPVCLMTCFKVAFGNLYEEENHFDPVKAAFVREDNSYLGTIFGQVFEDICQDEKNSFFERITVDTAADGEKHLVSGDVHVLFIVRDGKLFTEYSEKKTDVDKIIVNAFLDGFMAEAGIMETAAKNGADLTEFAEHGLSRLEVATQKTNIYNETPDPYMWYFYSTFVMALLFNILTGIGIVADIQADVTPGAMRVSVSSAKKSSILLAAFAARLVTMSMVSALVLLLMRFAFQVPLGHNIGLLALFVIVCEIFALSCGEVLGLWLKGSVDARENKATGLLMASVFISGEMVATLPGLLEKSAPIINRINPATIMNFAFYKLVYYSDRSGFYVNIASILAASVVFLISSVLIMRRQRYASV